ncbi:uncharacterized protein LOC116841107 [Odontomachus brunneus]|uniref:uncharacterized protein LOC116841107 n=1 Tax=Odontomachus brunneus TaxID=486640 RepID=UPI0013F1F122|nr:uncharacterized protein LOC116841107 [Odontomachus brunneus]
MWSRSSVFPLVVCVVATTALATTAPGVQEVCRQGVGDELIWEYDVRRPQRSGGYQEVDAEYGPTEARITCIRIDSLSEEENGAAWVTLGGIGSNYVKLKFRSRYSRGLHYRVYVYGLRLSILKQTSARPSS